MESNPILLLVLFLAFDFCLTQEPQEKICVNGYELSFFYGITQWRNNSDARKACEQYGGSHLVKVDNTAITTAIDSRIKTIFYIDGKADAKRKWTWSDGSMVYLPNESGGYQNWADGQPNNLGGEENCIIVGRTGKKWRDSSCKEKLGYICQKDLDPCITADSPIPNVHKCVATGSKVPQVEWRKESAAITTNSKQSLYQRKGSKTATLFSVNASIGDAGEYKCAAWIAGNGMVKFSNSVLIEVNGKPSIIDIKPFPCNSSLLVSWKPNQRAVGFPHRIQALSKSTVFTTKHVTPNEPGKLLTEITGLLPSTKYLIKILPCENSDLCPNDQGSDVNATTGGSYKTVTNVRLDNTCIITWNWPYAEKNVTKFLVRLHSVGFPENDDEKRIVEATHGNYSYSFEPQQNLFYSAKVQLSESVKICGEVTAVGNCMGKGGEDKTSTRASTVIAAILPIVGTLLLAVIGLVLWKRKKSGRTETTSTINAIQPEIRVVTDTVYENSTEYINAHQYAKIDDVATAAAASGYVNIVYQNVVQEAHTSSVYEN